MDKFSDDNIRAIHARMLAMGLVPQYKKSGPPVYPPLYHEKNGMSADPAPASPVDDEATVEELIGSAPSHTLAALPADQRKSIFTIIAKAHIAAIRRGDVQGLPSPDEHAALKAEAERLRTDLQECEEDCAEKRQIIERFLEDEPKQNRIVSDLKAEVERLRQAKDEVDTLKAEVERLRVDQKIGLFTAAKLNEVERERDAAIARAEAAEAVIKEQQNALNDVWPDGIVTCFNGKKHKMHDGCLYCMAEAAIARAEAAEELLQEIVRCDTGNIYSVVPHGDMARAKNHLAKYGKDASK